MLGAACNSDRHDLGNPDPLDCPTSPKVECWRERWIPADALVRIILKPWSIFSSLSPSDLIATCMAIDSRVRRFVPESRDSCQSPAIR